MYWKDLYSHSGRVHTVWVNKIHWLEWSPVWILQVLLVQKGFRYDTLLGLMEKASHLISTQILATGCTLQ